MHVKAAYLHLGIWAADVYCLHSAVVRLPATTAVCCFKHKGKVQLKSLLLTSMQCVAPGAADACSK